MKRNAMPTPEVLWSKFDLDPSTGILTWKPIPSTMPAKRYTKDWHANMWNGVHAGKPVMNRRSRRGGVRTGMQVSVDGVYYFVHRIVWVMCSGDIPEGMHIDHINRDPWDNRIENLRLATNAQNVANSQLRRVTSSGLKGVTLQSRSSDKWVARIVINGTMVNLGTYSCPKEAHAIYCEVAKAVYGEFFNP